MGGLRKGVGGSVYIEVRDWRQGQTCRGGGGSMVNQLGEIEGVKGRQEFQAAGIHPQLQLQVAELVGVVRNLAQQVNQIKVEVGGKGVIEEKVWDVTSGPQKGTGMEGMEIGNKGKGLGKAESSKIRGGHFVGDVH